MLKRKHTQFLIEYKKLYLSETELPNFRNSSYTNLTILWQTLIQNLLPITAYEKIVSFKPKTGEFFLNIFHKKGFLHMFEV